MADTFGGLSFGDLANMSGLTKGGVQALDKAGFIPHGSAVGAAKRMAVIGGLVSAGVSAMAAGGIAAVLRDCFNRYDGEVYSGIDQMVHRQAMQGRLPGYLDNRPADADELWYHDSLYHHWADYPRGKTQSGDAIVEIVDRSYIFLGQADPKIHTLGADAEGFSLVGVVKKWTRAGQAEIEHAFSERPPEWIANTRRNASGKVVVNVSLAIRNGFDRLVESRRGRRVVMQ